MYALAFKVEAACWRRQPVRFEIQARTLLLDVQSQRPVLAEAQARSAVADRVTLDRCRDPNRCDART